MNTSDQIHQITVTVVIVTRGRVAVLRDCLDSIQAQSRVPDQIVVVAGDDDSCPEELVSQIDQCVLTHCPEPNICKARNIGLDYATGTLVLFIDDDATAEHSWIQAYIDAYLNHSSAWIAGGIVFDARTNPLELEFANGLINPSGMQIEVRPNPSQHAPRGYLPTVKGCNFAIFRNRVPAGSRFDSFFRFAFDEADFVMNIHEDGGGVISVSDAVVHHLHAPGLYRASHPLDRDWYTEFASHTMFMLKHTRGLGRWAGWGVVIRRLLKHTIVAILGAVLRRVDQDIAFNAILTAGAGVRYAAVSNDNARSSR